MTTNDNSQGRKRKTKLWNATVDLPRGAAIADAPSFVVNYLGKTLQVDSLKLVDFAGVQPGRTFVGSTKKRNRPTRPFLYNQGVHALVESETEGVEGDLLDRDPDIQRLVPQGLWIKCFVPSTTAGRPGQWRWSCADFLVQRTNGSLAAIEVKRHDYTFKPRAVAKLLATADTCDRAYLRYEVRAGLSLRQEQLFRLLYPARRSHFLQQDEHHRLRAAMAGAAAEGPVTINELRALGPSTVTATLVWELLWNEVLCIDWSAIVTSSTPVRLHGAGCANARGTSAWDFVCGLRRIDLLEEMREWAGSA